MQSLATATPTTVIRPGTQDDNFAAFEVYSFAIHALCQQIGVTPADAPPPTADAILAEWERDQSIYQHLLDTAEAFWVAEQNGRLVGFARTNMNDGVRELTEFFVRPNTQGAGIGQRLLEKAFPAAGARHRCIIATIDPSAQALYLKQNVFPTFPLYSFGRQPEPVSVATDLEIVPAELALDTLAALTNIDKQVVGFEREANHRWLLNNRQAFIYLRHSQPVGYGYVGRDNGPFALLDEDDFPAVLAHAESEAHRQERPSFNLIVPLINQTAVRYLLQRRFRMAKFFCQVMMERPFGHFEQYIAPSPMYFI